MPGAWCAGLLQADAIASLAELHGNVGSELAGMATEHSQLSARLTEAEAAERKLDALAQLQQRLADFDVLLSRGAPPDRPVCCSICLSLSSSPSASDHGGLTQHSTEAAAYNRPMRESPVMSCEAVAVLWRVLHVDDGCAADLSKQCWI